MRRILSLFLVLLFVTGCGGGSGEGSNIETSQEPPCPENVEEYSYQDQNSWQYLEELCDNGSVVSYSCQRENGGIVAFGDNLNGVCKYLGERSVEPSTEEIPEGATSYECPNRFDFSHFLYDTLNGELSRHFANGVVHYTPGESQISRFNNRPELGIAEGTTNFQENALRIAVGTINGALPDEYNIRILPNKVQARQAKPPSGSIYVDFAPRGEWIDYENYDEPFGVAVKYNNESPNRSIHVWINSEEIESFSMNKLLWVISHELFHASGFPRHIATAAGGNNFFPYESVLWRALPTEGVRVFVGERNGASSRFVPRSFQFRENGILYPVDWWGLKYLYEELETGDSTDFYQGPDDLTYPEFDDWLREKGC